MEDIIQVMEKRPPLKVAVTDKEILKLDGGEAKVQLQKTSERLKATEKVLSENNLVVMKLIKGIDNTINEEDNITLQEIYKALVPLVLLEEIESV